MAFFVGVRPGKAHGGRALSRRHPGKPGKARQGKRQTAHLRFSRRRKRSMPKTKRPKKAPPATMMTTAEATVATLIAHGLDTIYALPGVHNDYLFDALHQAGDKLRVVHTRHEQGAAYMALGAALATGKAAGLFGGAGAGPAQFRRGAAHRLRHERAGAGADRTDSGGDHRQGAWLPARDPRPGRHHRAPGRSFRAHRRRRGSAGQGGKGHPLDARRPARPGGARMRHRRLGQARRGGSDPAAQTAAGAAPQRGRGAHRGQASRQRQARAHRRRRRRAGCVRRSDAALGYAAGPGDGLPARARRARRALPVQRHAADRLRPVERGRRDARRRHQAQPDDRLGHRQQARQSCASIPIRKSLRAIASRLSR